MTSRRSIPSGRRSAASVLATVPRPILALGTVLVLLLVVRGVGIATAEASVHPPPREGITANSVLPASRYADYPMIVQVYQQAKEIPDVLDGLYCYCHCAEHDGHRSLLSCFESDHGAGCDVCLQEAALAHTMRRGGASLREIQDAIDAMFAT